MNDVRHSPMDVPVDPILQEMVGKYPRLFHGSTPRAHSDIQPGWKALVDGLCYRINGMLTEEKARLFAVKQIKEKLGTLRFYFSFDRDVEQPFAEQHPAGTIEMGSDVDVDRNIETFGKIRAAIEVAISLSNTTCSVCGQPGRMRHLDGLLSVRCDDHSSVR